ncbi:MAG: heme-binding protein [Bacteroidetes bacterium]|nr:heme-binding protein [Bacteroidota bacterium]
MAPAKIRFHLCLSIFIFLGFVATIRPVMSYEEPDYKIVRTSDVYEIRHYPKRVVAEVIYGIEDGGFRALFDYISGVNEASEKVQMTVPVTQSEKIDMTAPVTQSNQDGKMVMQFFLPKQYSSQTAPKPTDPRIAIVELPETYFAVLSYSGSASDRNFEKRHKELKAALDEDGMTITGAPIKATYNSPFTLPFLRRNEAMYPVNWE